MADAMVRLTPPRPIAARRSLVSFAGACALLGSIALAACSGAAAPAAAHPGRSSGPYTVSAVRKPGTVAHWGSFFGAKSGNFDVLTSPVTISLPGAVKQVGTSNSTQYALLANGSLYAWGMGNAGQLGDGRTRNSFVRPMRVQFPAGVRIAWIPTDVMPFDTGLAVDTTGKVWGWGLNSGGELCLGNRQSYLTPVRLPLAAVTAAAGASNHALYDSGGTVYACGQNVYGDLGSGSTGNSTTPVKVARLPALKVMKLVASFANSGALLAGGRYYDWGYNASGQLGTGQAGQPSDVPVRVRLRSAVKQVALGGSIWSNGQTLAMLADGSLWAWGDDHACQLGDRQRRGMQPVPLQVHAPRGVAYRTLATGSATSYAVSTSGQVYAWGVSHVGQLGNGSTKTSCVPLQVASAATLISATANNVVVKLNRH